MAEVTVYFTTISSSLEIKKKQQKVRDILGENYRGLCPIVYVDIAADSSQKEKMREIIGNPKALPPQICRGSEYLGDFSAFDDAVEREDIKGFLKI